VTLSDLAARLGLAWEGADVAVTRPALLDDTGPGSICLATSADYMRRAAEAGSAALLAPLGIESSLPCLRAEKPRVAFARLLALFDTRPLPAAGIHPSAVVAPTASIDPTASIGPNAVVEDGAAIGARTAIGANAYVGHASVIGDDCTLGPGATIHHGCTVGHRVCLQSGVVIGSDGFGYEWDGHQHVPVPHLGTVVIEDDVTIGANSTVDRAKTAETRIRRGAKLDNLIQIGHGVQVGAYVLMAAQVGVGGSTVIEDGVVLAGQVGIADAVRVGAGAVVAAQSGIVSTVDGGVTYMGTPIREIGEARRMIASLSRLPALFTRVRALERRANAANRPAETAAERPNGGDAESTRPTVL
jgi:UDP-3-O-[3-hydroxymyristoyl] glucosamine N-acyltransferase